MHWQIAIIEQDQKACWALRAREYGRLYSGIPTDYFDDEFDHAKLSCGIPQAYTVFIPRATQVIATLRVMYIRHPSNSNLCGELETLMEFHGDLEEHVAKITGTSRQELCVLGEMTRLSIDQYNNH